MKFWLGPGNLRKIEKWNHSLAAVSFKLNQGAQPIDPFIGNSAYIFFPKRAPKQKKVNKTAKNLLRKQHFLFEMRLDDSRKQIHL